MSSALYANFFSSQTVSVLFCLQELVHKFADPDPENPIVKFILAKIMTINEIKLQIKTNALFEAELL